MKLLALPISFLSSAPVRVLDVRVSGAAVVTPGRVGEWATYTHNGSDT